jgi:glucosamine--fructose-6-phosphate aminotransferase (isomerizing)
MSASLMFQEAREASAATRRLLSNQKQALAQAAAVLQAGAAPITTAARGSSDHAMSAFKYACEILLGKPVASIGPSIASVYKSELKLPGGVHLTVSQSGASPDIIALQEAAKRGGAKCIAFVNVATSPLAAAADLVVALEAGEEKSVAATKSYIASCVALFSVVAAAAGDVQLQEALERLPDALDALTSDATDPLAQALADERSLYITGRGPAFGVALEAALKAKETAGIHAEAFSSAELMHGPLQLVQPGFPVVVLAAEDASMEGTVAAIQRLRALGGRVYPISTAALEGGVRVPSTGHPIADTMVLALAWYLVVEKMTTLRGLDPDKPANLKKVTETV